MIIDQIVVEKKEENYLKDFLKTQEAVHKKYEGVDDIQIRVKDLAQKFEITVFHEPELKEASIVKIKKEEADSYDGAEGRSIYYRTALSVIGMDEEYLYLLER